MEKTYYLPEGTVLQGKYYIQAAIGEGGFGITYRAFDGVLKRQVAIKEYYPAVLVNRNCTYQLRSGIRIRKGDSRDKISIAGAGCRNTGRSSRK